VAGVTDSTVRVPSAAQQMLLIAWLRWRMFANSLGSWTAKLEVMAQAVVALLAGLFTLLIGAGFAAGAYFLVALGHKPMLAWLLWGVLLGWQLLPVMMATFGSQLPFRDLLRYPVRFRTFYLLSLGYGFFDPAALAALIWLACLAAGAAAADPALLPSMMLIFPFFVLMNLAFNRVLFSWLERLLARRRSREILFALFIIGIFSIQFTVAFVEDNKKEALQVWRWVEPLLTFTPPNLAAAPLMAPDSLPLLLSAQALLAVYAAVFGLGLAVRLRKQFLGEDLGESPAAATPKEKTRAEGWHLARLAPPVAAAFEKEIRYLLRNTMMIMNALIPVVMVFFFSIISRRPRSGRDAEFLANIPDMMFPGMIAYALTVLLPMAYNSFAHEGRGIQFLLVAPVRFRDVMLGKNLAHATVVGGNVVAIWVSLAVLGRTPGMWTTLVTLAALVVMMMGHYALANILSIIWPRAAELDKMKAQMRGLSVLLFLTMHVVLLLFSAIVYGIGVAFQKPWLPLVFLVMMGFTASRAYLYYLEQCDQLALSRRDVLTEELCKS